MKELRPKTIKEIEQKLDNSYFTKASFEINNKAHTEPFLEILFIPKKEYIFTVYTEDDDSFITKESPGTHMTSGEEFYRKGFRNVMSAIGDWLSRIQEDIKYKPEVDLELEEFLNGLRSQIISDKDEEGEFTTEEIKNIREKLDSLEAIVESQAEKIKASENQVNQFKKEIENIKNDLSIMPKGVWHKIAGNKLLKSITTFLKTEEGRKLIADGLRKLIG